RLGVPARRNGVPRHLPMPARRWTPVPPPPSSRRCLLAVPLADLPDHARRGTHQDARRSLLARPHLPVLPLRDAAESQPAQPRPPLHAEIGRAHARTPVT